VRAPLVRVSIRSASESDAEIAPKAVELSDRGISFLRRFFATKSSVNPAIMSAKTKAQGIIDENAVAVFSKSWCPYCKATKSLLSELGAKYYSIELDQVDDGDDLQVALKDLTRRHTGNLAGQAAMVRRQGANRP
jgi:glutaredoxin